MKVTVWEIDQDNLELRYYHESGEILIRQDTGHPSGGEVVTVSIDESEAGALARAIMDLRNVVLDEQIDQAEQAA